MVMERDVEGAHIHAIPPFQIVIVGAIPSFLTQILKRFMCGYVWLVARILSPPPLDC